MTVTVMVVTMDDWKADGWVGKLVWSMASLRETMMVHSLDVKMAVAMDAPMADSKVSQSGRSMAQSWAAMTAPSTAETTEIDSVAVRAVKTDSSMVVRSVAMLGDQKAGTTVASLVVHLDCMWEYWTVAVWGFGMAAHSGQRWVVQMAARSVVMLGDQKAGLTVASLVVRLDCLREYWTVAVWDFGMADHSGQRWVVQMVDG
jgi:hypothetical protein